MATSAFPGGTQKFIPGWSRGRSVFPLGHMGLTVALGRMVLHQKSKVLDYRVLLLGSMLPDFIDKPIGLALTIEGRNVAHTLLFAVTLTLGLTLLLLSRRLGPAGSQRLTLLWPLSLGVWTHLLLDRMWEMPHTVLWPFLGWGFPHATLDLQALLLSLYDPYVLSGELLGLSTLLLIFWRHKVYRRENLRLFLRKGSLG